MTNKVIQANALISTKKISKCLFAAALAIVALIGFGCASETQQSSPTLAQPANGVQTSAPAAPAETVAAMPAPAPAPAPEIKPAARNFTLKFVKADSEETSSEDAKGANAVDGDPNTFWHTAWSDTNNPPCPHEIVIEIVPPAAIKGFTYLPRQDDSANGMIKDYEFYTSDDGADFGQPVSKGTFENNKDKKTVSFDARKCRFIKLKALSEVNDAAWSSAAEIGVVPAN